MLFFFNDPAPTEIYTLSLHDALPIYTLSVASGNTIEPMPRPSATSPGGLRKDRCLSRSARRTAGRAATRDRSEEHTSELQPPCNSVARFRMEQKTLLIGRSTRTIARA